MKIVEIKTENLVEIKKRKDEKIFNDRSIPT